jgi:hypothetical protein
MCALQSSDGRFCAERGNSDRVNVVRDVGVDQLDFFVGLIRAVCFEEFDVILLRGITHSEQHKPEELVFLKNDPGNSLFAVFLLFRAAAIQRQSNNKEKEQE